MKKKIIATLCAALMLSGVITGCSGSASSGSQAAASTGTSANTASGAEGKTTLNVLWWGSQTRHEMTTEMLEKFEELNPDIDVVMDYSDWDGYWTKLPAQVAGGQTPDVFQMDYAKLAEYVENGVTADLSSYIADGSLDMSNVEQNILDSGTVDGKVYAISTGTNAPALLYRQDILDELGLSLPMNPTMSEYAEVSKAVYEATGLRDTFITDSSAVIFRQHLRNYGLNLYNEDATALGFDDPKYLVNMWNLALQAQEEGWGLLPGEATATTAFDSMVTDAWSRLQNSNELQAYREATGKDIRMVMIPSLDDATTPVSYTHLDVYKRQGLALAAPCGQQRHRPQSGQRYQRLRAAHCNRLTLGSLRTVRESLGQSNEFLACKAQAVEDRYGIVLFHRAEQGPAGVGAQRLRVPL